MASAAEILARFDAPAESSRGIPLMTVVEDVQEYMKKEGDTAPTESLNRLTEAFKKYKYVESNLASQKERLLEKLPEYNRSLEIVDVLIQAKERRAPLETHHVLSESVFTKARVEKPESVSIWLGANVMVEYTLDEAKVLLTKNRDTVQKAVDELSRELLFVKDQITTTEVNIAHLHNYSVRHKNAAIAVEAK